MSVRLTASSGHGSHVPNDRHTKSVVFPVACVNVECTRDATSSLSMGLDRVVA